MPFCPEDHIGSPDPKVIAQSLKLDAVQTEWLLAHPSEAATLFEGLTESLADENPSTGLAYFHTFSPAAIKASKIAIIASMNNVMDGPYDNIHFLNITQHLPQSSDISDPVFWQLFSIQCALIKLEHPEYSTFRVYWEASKEMVHFSLDMVGLVPGFGEIADLANGAIYLIEGDGVNASLSFAAAIPFAGWVATGLKFAKKTITALDGTRRTLKWIVDANGFIKFGDRGQLRRVLGLAKGDTRFAHHIIPWDLCDDKLVQQAAKGNNAFHMNELANGIPANAIQHNNGGHLLYNEKVRNKLDDLWNRNGRGNITPDLAAGLLRDLTNQIKNWMIAHPNESINNIIL